jgi:hypothetical protein
MFTGSLPDDAYMAADDDLVLWAGCLDAPSYSPAGSCGVTWPAMDEFDLCEVPSMRMVMIRE